MATTANPPPGAYAVEDSDPFLSTPQDVHRQRYSNFDNSQFSLYLNGSPAQAKRALQAHLSETTRRLQETSHIGNALVQQRKELEEKLKEVDMQEADAEIGPELRSRLAELEKEFNEVGRETARAFLPKSRAPSGETDVQGVSVYTSEVQPSPSKMSVPSRKQRNQQPSRINDIALATEISTSLLAQLKDLQAVLLDKDEMLKAANLDRSQLEIEVEGLSQRLRTLDESESRLKDVNWNLETQVREFETQSKAAADKEHRLNQNLNLAKSEKSALEREFEELKQMYAKLNDDQSFKVKQHETELSGLRRNVSMGETERGALQRKVEELATQNQELAKAVAYRMRSDEQGSNEEASQDEGADEGNTITPEHSPPSSPTKATPRHGQLESETLKHSLHHAHRMIQQLKNNIHREKTEKMELKRMLQDARDELETSRSAITVPTSASKRRKNGLDVFKKPARPDRLGAPRTDSHEIVLDDDEWEEHDGIPPTPSKKPKQADAVPGAYPGGFSSAAETSANEGFETANETSDAAFETANERDGTTTETDAFQTGAETLDGNSSDDLTETEAGPSTGTVRYRPSAQTRASIQDSYESTASTSGDEWDDKEVQTPLQSQHPRYRLKVRQGYRRTTPRGSQDMFPGTPPPAPKDSPASYASHSNRSTPIQGQSLMAELGAFSGGESDGSGFEDTPSRSSLLSPESSPEAVLKKSPMPRSPLQTFQLPRPVMVDSGVMTEAWEPTPIMMEPPTQNIEKSSIWSQATQPKDAPQPTLHMSSLATQGTMPQSAPAPSLRLAEMSSQGTEPQSAPRPLFQRSVLSSQDTEPQSAPRPSFQRSVLSSQDTVPQSAPRPTFQRSMLSSQDTVPRSIPSPALQLSSFSGQGTEPRSPPPHALNISALSSQGTEPQHQPRPAYTISSVSSQDTIPRAMPQPSFALSSHSSQATDPISPAVEQRVAPSLDVSTVTGQTTEPKEPHSSHSLAAVSLAAAGLSTLATEPVEASNREIEHREMPEQTPLGMAALSSQNTVPTEAPQLPPLSMSGLFSQTTGPVEWARPAPPQLSRTLSSQTTEPIEVTRPAAPRLSTTMSSQATEPVTIARPVLRSSNVSFQATDPVEVSRPAPSLSAVSSQATDPVEVHRATPSLSTVSSQATDPVEVHRAAPSLSTVHSQATDPVEVTRASSRLSNVSSQATDPVEVSRAAPQFSSVTSQATEPVQLPMPTRPQFSTVSSQTTKPVEAPKLSLSTVPRVAAQQTEPVEPKSSAHRYSDVTIVHDTQPESPTLPSFLPSPSRPSTANRVVSPPLSFSTIVARDTEPLVPSRPATAHRTAPVPIAETARPSSKEARAPKTPMADGGTQTMVSSEQIDRLLLARSQRYSSNIAYADVDKAMSPPASPSRRNSNDSNRPHRRPGSASSNRSRTAVLPPLPPDHKQVIAAASLKSPALPAPAPASAPPATPGKMGPPGLPASIINNNKRPQTPTIKTTPAPASPKVADSTTRSLRAQSRRSSVSSFSSEIDHRFNIAGMTPFGQSGLDANQVDPRMIQAITQTMFGEFMWKYTRKAGSQTISGTRHRRYFWIHPFTRTLYWSKDGPNRGQNQMSAKSVAIEAVHAVSDNNPLPPGLHEKSIVITTPGRTIQFTATTSQRHDTWMNALLYLLKRTDEDEEPKAESNEIQTEFNGGLRSTSRATGRSRLSHATSYMSQRTSSPHGDYPTLRPSQVTPSRPTSVEPGHGSAGRLSTMFRSRSNIRGSFSTRFSKTSVHESEATPDEPDHATEELGHDIVTPLARPEGFAMEDVRACCNGKHHLHQLPHTHSTKSRHGSYTGNSRPSLIGSMSSRSHSRAESYGAS